MSGWSTTSGRKTRPPWVPHAGGRLYPNFVEQATTTLAITKDILIAVPFFVPVKATYTSIGLEVSTFGACNGRLGIYTDTNGAPDALVLDAGVISHATSNGFKSKVISQILDVGWYWLAGVFDATASTVRATTAAGCFRHLGFTSGTDTTTHPGWSVAFAYAALPNPFQAGGALMTTAPPRIMIGF